MGLTTRAGDFYQTRLWIDYVIVSLVGVASALTPLSSILSADHRIGFFTANVTLASLAMAAAIFARTMTYSSRSVVMLDALVRFDTLLHRSWTAIVRDLFLCALLGVSCFLLDPISPAIAVGVTMSAVILTALRFGRAAFWMNFTQSAERISARSRIVDEPSYS